MSPRTVNIGGVVNARIPVLAGNNQAAVNTPVATRPSVGHGLGRWRASGTHGVVHDDKRHRRRRSAITDCGGVATITSWTLGQTAGPQTLTVSTPGAPSVTFNATGIGGPPAKLAITTQPSATAVSGVALVTQPVIQALDQFGNPSEQIDVLQITAVWSTGSERNNTVFASSTGGRAL
jgi:hypothetical protein